MHPQRDPIYHSRFGRPSIDLFISSVLCAPFEMGSVREKFHLLSSGNLRCLRYTSPKHDRIKPPIFGLNSVAFRHSSIARSYWPDQ